jgi:hypothetical protein
MANAQPSAAQIAQQNYINRQNLIQTGLHMVKQLQPVTQNALGGTMKIPLERMGIMTGIMLDVTVPLNVTATATASPFAPYNFFNSISYTDYAGLQRVLTSGYQLHALNSIRGNRFTNNSRTGGVLTLAETSINTDILNLPTAIAVANLNFSIFIPIAYDAASDLRGAVLSQTIYGDHYVTVTLPQVMVGSDPLMFPYTAGTVALNAGGNVSITAYQHYIMPQQGVANLPMIDLSTIYAIEGNYSDSANIVAGQAKYLNWPNNRAIMSANHIFNQAATGGVLNSTDVSRIVLLGNSNTNIREMSPRYLRNSQRYHLGADFPSGVFWINSRTQPITTQLYGNVQSRFDIATAAANSYFLSQYESTYMSGTPLPGVIQ